MSRRRVLSSVISGVGVVKRTYTKAVAIRRQPLVAVTAVMKPVSGVANPN
jgi:hypothetical protein